MRKKFYYESADYLHRTYRETYTREGTWKRIYYTITGKPFFRHHNKRYHLDDFLSTGTPWTAGITDAVKSADGEAVTLAGYEAETYYKPLFIEIDASGEGVRVYRYEGSETID